MLEDSVDLKGRDPHESPRGCWLSPGSPAGSPVEAGTQPHTISLTECLSKEDFFLPPMPCTGGLTGACLFWAVWMPAAKAAH